MTEYKIVMGMGATTVHALTDLEHKVNEAHAEGYMAIDPAHIDVAPGGYVAWKEMGRYDFEPEPEEDEPEPEMPEPIKRSTRKRT